MRGNQSWTCGSNTVIVCIETVLYGISEGVHVPTVHEVAVETIAGGVAVGERKLPTSGLIDVIGPIKDFNEQ